MYLIFSTLHGAGPCVGFGYDSFGGIRWPKMPSTLIIYRERQAVPGEFGRGRAECPGRFGHPQGDCHLKQRLRHFNKTMIYCGRLQRPMPVLSAKKVLDVLQHASGPFSPAALASAFSLDLVTTLVLLECLRQR